MDSAALADLTWLDVAVRLGLAALAGTVVGFEREVDGKDAGVRTHMLLAVGAATFGLISVGGFDAFVQAARTTNTTIDVTRVASYVAAGVGFLGGGTILKGSDQVKGLTTAASLWVVAAVGLAAGIGFVAAAVIGSLLAMSILLAERPLQGLARRLRSDQD